jgi:hypothetical protein
MRSAKSPLPEIVEEGASIFRADFYFWSFPFSSIKRASIEFHPKRRRATLTGNLNLRGPALPGFKKRTPFRSTADG